MIESRKYFEKEKLNFHKKSFQEFRDNKVRSVVAKKNLREPKKFFAKSLRKSLCFETPTNQSI